MSDPASENGPSPRTHSQSGALPVSGPGNLVPAGMLAWLPWIAAAGFALVAGFLLQAYFEAENELVELRTQAALAAIETRSLQQTLEAERIIAARRLADRAKEPPAAAGLSPNDPNYALLLPPDATGGGVAVVVWNAGAQEGTLFVRRLPALSPDKGYQFWVGDSQTPPQTAATFEGSATGEARVPFRLAHPPGSGARFVVTIEPKAGSATMSGPVVLSSQ